VGSKIILVLHTLTGAQENAVRMAAPGYELVIYSETLQLDEQLLSRVEIVSGWIEDLAQWILSDTNSSLRWIQLDSAGIEKMDCSLLQSRGITLTNARGIHERQITESVFGILLAHVRGIDAAIRNQVSKKWQRNVPPGELHGRTILVAGTGSIGQGIAKMAHEAFEMRTLGVNRSGHASPYFDAVCSQSDILTLLPDADIVVSVLPLTRETYHFFDSHLFAEMKPGTYFINVGRGDSVDTAALIDGLDKGRPEFAGLDVFEEEPLPSDHPLWIRDDVLITPHIAGVTTYYYEREQEVFLRNLRSWVQYGRPEVNIIDLVLGY